MEQFPSSPEDVIDSRWTSPPQAVAPTPHGSGRRKSPKPELDDQMRAIIKPWLAGERSATDTLQALQVLANQHL